jgi:hypothetical protein
VRRTAILIVILAVLTYAGEWVYRGFIRPPDPMPPVMIALADHFDRNGIRVSPYAVRHGFRHSELQAVAAFKLPDFPIPFLVFVCPDEPSAVARLDIIKRNPDARHADRNGRLVLDLGLWADDDEQRASKVTGVFNTFDGGVLQ